jgi:hypothetical protein
MDGNSSTKRPPRTPVSPAYGQSTMNRTQIMKQLRSDLPKSTPLPLPPAHLPQQKSRTVSPSSQASTSTPPHHTTTSVRTMVMLELLETERTYCKNLDLLIEHYMKPTVQEFGQRAQPIFSNVGSVRDINAILLQKLEERMASFSAAQTKIGDIFLEIGPYCKPHYSSYGMQYAQAQQTLKDLEENDAKVAIWLERIRSQVPELKGNSLR